MENIIELKNITKRFPKVVANDNISMEVRQGEIHALAGENGAGKSTLMNIIYGLYQPDEGEIVIRGKPVRFSGSADSIAHGIGMVHQHFMLIPKMTVAENIIVGEEPGSFFKVQRKEAEKAIGELARQYGLNIQPDALVSKLSVTEQQRVEILKVLYRKADILIFDEPTAVLTPQEIDDFCDILLGLKKQGKTIIFINHKLDEVMKISDRITVIRHGRVIGTVVKEQTNKDELTRMMVGRDVNLNRRERPETESTTPLLEAKEISYKKEGVQKLNKLNLSLRRGEILGIAGVDGNGQEEFVDILTGKVLQDSGSLTFKEKEITKDSIRERMEDGISIIPEDRHKEGLVLDFSIDENLILGRQYQKDFSSSGVWLMDKEISENGKKMKEEFDIRCPSTSVAARTLSGGNQQKIVFAREISADPDVIIAVQPTRGLDVGAIEFVYETLLEMRNRDKGVLLFSLELDEILSLCDRVAVIFNGQIMDILDAENVTRQELGLLMLGSKEKGEGDDQGLLS